MTAQRKAVHQLIEEDDLVMTAQEVAVIVAEVRRDRQHDYAPDPDANHDQYGNDTRDHHMFNHVEDPFPY